MVHPNRCHGPYYAYPGEGSVQMCWDGGFKITFDHCIGLGCRNSRVGLVRSLGSFIIRSKVVLLAKSPSCLATWWPKIWEKGGKTWQFLQTIQVIFRLSNILTHKFPCVKIFLIIIGRDPTTLLHGNGVPIDKNLICEILNTSAVKLGTARYSFLVLGLWNSFEMRSLHVN